MKENGFPPIADSNSRVLILGTFPGPLSLELNQSYAHPRNIFWRIMTELVGFNPKANYENRIMQLKSGGIALWDVLASCDRDGAADARIRNPVANDFKSFFAEHQKINKVFFNGRKAESLYSRLVKNIVCPSKNQYFYLPSTSPANAGTEFNKKLEAWRKIIQ